MYNVYTDTILVGIWYSSKFKLTSTTLATICTNNYEDQVNSSFSGILFSNLTLHSL